MSFLMTSLINSFPIFHFKGGPTTTHYVGNAFNSGNPGSFSASKVLDVTSYFESTDAASTWSQAGGVFTYTGATATIFVAVHECHTVISGGNDIEIQIRKNGAVVASQLCQNSEYQGQSVSAIFTITTNDTIDAYYNIISAGTYDPNQYSIISIIKLA